MAAPTTNGEGDFEPRSAATDHGEGEARRRPGRPSLSNEALLDKALDLFLDKGFDGTSIDAITAAAGMAKRTVYARYGDKTRLFKAALSRAIDDWIIPVEALRALEDPDFARTLVALGDALVANVLNPGGLRLMRLTNAESVRMPEISAENVRLGTEPTLVYLADLFVRRAALSQERAVQAAQAFLYLIVAGPANSAAWGIALDMDAVQRQTRFGVRLLMQGLDISHEPTDRRLQQLIMEAGERLDEARERLR
jgi:AcrR family transcriptional regulator